MIYILSFIYYYLHNLYLLNYFFFFLYCVFPNNSPVLHQNILISLETLYYFLPSYFSHFHYYFYFLSHLVKASGLKNILGYYYCLLNSFLLECCLNSFLFFYLSHLCLPPHLLYPKELYDILYYIMFY